MSDIPYFLNNYTFRPEFCNYSSNNVYNTVPSQIFSVPPAVNPGWNQQHPISDQEFVKQYERLIPTTLKQNNKKSLSITGAKRNLHTLLTALNTAKEKQTYLKENVESLDTEEWTKNHQEFLNNKLLIENQMREINDSYLSLMSKALVQRGSKRMRLKRLRGQRQVERQEVLKKRQEKSRSIDESLQKIVDDIAKVKEDEQSKLQADAVLKEVLRKKHDAKKYIAKLDGLLKLRKARLNTAKGRGVDVSESATSKFNQHIEKLTLLWTKKLAMYEKEEIALRNTLNDAQNTRDDDLNSKEKVTMNNLKKWREFLFGDADVWPQREFAGDLRRFVDVRSDWDKYESEDGTSLPIGWVLPE